MKNMFVYGSLKKGFFDHHLISDNPRNKLIKRGTIDGYGIYLLCSSPAVKPLPSLHKIFVELYSLSDEVFEKIDKMEKQANHIPIEVE